MADLGLRSTPKATQGTDRPCAKPNDGAIFHVVKAFPLGMQMWKHDIIHPPHSQQCAVRFLLAKLLVTRDVAVCSYHRNKDLHQRVSSLRTVMTPFFNLSFNKLIHTSVYRSMHPSTKLPTYLPTSKI